MGIPITKKYITIIWPWFVMLDTLVYLVRVRGTSLFRENIVTLLKGKSFGFLRTVVAISFTTNISM